MDRDRVREIARKGGQAAHRKGTAHKWNETEAIEAGRKGGLARHRVNSVAQPMETASATHGAEMETRPQQSGSLSGEFAG
jgi:general stress protein YciG